MANIISNCWIVKVTHFNGDFPIDNIRVLHSQYHLKLLEIRNKLPDNTNEKKTKSIFTKII